jgi:TonB family C-terminal domain
MFKKAAVVTLMFAVTVTIAGCRKDGKSSFSGVGPRPDVLPVMLNKDLPFRYPPSLYSKKVQANVTLRVFIDKDGSIVAESTHVAESSGFPALDSAAVRGSNELRFVPAKTRGQAVLYRFYFPSTSGILKRHRSPVTRFSRRQEQGHSRPTRASRWLW